MVGAVRFVVFSVRRAWRGFWRNALMSFAATATMILMLFLLAGFWVLQVGLGAGLAYIEQKVEIVAYLMDDAGQPAVDDLQAEVGAIKEVRSVEYVSKDEALVRFRQHLKERGQEDLTGALETNPLPASLEVKLIDPREYGTVVETLTASKAVEKVEEIQKLVEQVTTVTNILRTAGLALLALVGFTVLFIIINTIRLAVVARSEEIEIMRLVGASDAFIRWPFIFEGALVGLFGAVVTIVLLLAAAGPLGEFMYGFFRVLPIEFGTLLVRDVTLLVFGAGIGLGILGSYVSVRSYLIR